ncbi:DNA-directed primase/polymerase protein isoform X4 [Poecile atricapillus]|uniref:DNA-directed primase/polymerase protein isoform X4 n=1 Tax=Poecile atricapillus TaxID=48891 RepID=UPI0027391FD3|nr:DNA-directed primase/polymerase protein isoform X4 [Poecile atricapillus]
MAGHLNHRSLWALSGEQGEMKRKWQERLKKVEELASHYERNPLPTVYKPRLSKPSMPSSVWKIFSRQAEAFSYVKTCNEDVHVFALEKNTQSGQRFYLVTTYKELWFYYTKDCKTSLMHCYEVIPAKDACKLYFDLEFYKPANPDADGKSMVKKLIELVSQKLKELYDVNCSSKDVLNLDSSTEEKFSRHLIFLPQKTVFKDNAHVGNFVRTILQPAIRLMESRAAVIPAEEAGHVFQCSAGVGLDGCLTNLTAVEDDSKDWPAAAHETKDMEMPHQGENLDFSFLIVNNKEGNQQLFVDLDPMEGYQGSPYPEIDNFVRSLVNKDGLQGGIRQWSYFSLKELLIYDISGYRWCENIGRAHKSNNIMILVDLKNEVWYQKCHDPVCREQNFKSQSFPLPPGICLPSLFKEEEESTLMDDRGNTEGNVNPHPSASDLSKSSVSPENSWSQDFLFADSEWENTSDDACFQEAAEDVELAEAADDSLNYAMEEIPDEVLLEALRKEDLYTKEGS